MSKENNLISMISKMVLPLIEPHGYELVDAEFVKEGREWVLRFFIDHENGVGLDDCEKVSRLISAELDRTDPISQAYLLEVSSPGIERPLKKISDFQRFKGHQVCIKLFSPKNGKKEFRGELLGENDEIISVKTLQGTIDVKLDEIAKANLVVEF